MSAQKTTLRIEDVIAQLGLPSDVQDFLKADLSQQQSVSGTSVSWKRLISKLHENPSLPKVGRFVHR